MGRLKAGRGQRFAEASHPRMPRLSHGGSLDGEVMSGTRFALLVRLSMPPAVQQRIASDRASWAALTAGTHEPEPDAAQVQRHGVVIDRDADRLYSDGVEHLAHTLDGLSGG